MPGSSIDDLPPGLQEIELEDALRAAKQGVAYWDEELGRRIGAAQALDGVGGLMSKLLGSYDADVDAAVGEVAAAKAQLFHAKQQVLQAQQALADWRNGQAQAADDAVAQVMAVEEAVASALRMGGPQAGLLSELEAQLAVVESRHRRLEEAHVASQDLVLELSRARAAANRGMPRRVTRYRAVGGRNYAPAHASQVVSTEGEYREVLIDTVSDVALAWEASMAALGVDAPPELQGAVTLALQVDGHYRHGEAAEGPVAAAQTAVEPMARKLTEVVEVSRQDLQAVQEQRAQAVGLELPSDATSAPRGR